MIWGYSPSWLGRCSSSVGSQQWPWGLDGKGMAAALAHSGGSGDLLIFGQTGSRDGEYWDSTVFFSVLDSRLWETGGSLLLSYSFLGLSSPNVPQSMSLR